MKVKPARALLARTIAILLLPVAAKASASGDETFVFVLGGSISKFDSEIRVNGDTRDANAKVDIEDDLGQDEDVDFLLLKAIWRFADRHRISLEFSPLSRTSRNVLDDRFEFKDVVIHAGGEVDTDTDFAIYDVNYIYSVYKTADLELGISAGVYWMGLDFELSASGLIEDEANNISFDESFNDSVDTDLPLPLVGIHLSYELAPRWTLHGSARYFDASLDSYSGEITSLLAGIDYAVFNNFSVGMSVARFDLEAEADEESFSGKFGWEYSGSQLYVKAAF